MLKSNYNLLLSKNQINFFNMEKEYLLVSADHCMQFGPKTAMLFAFLKEYVEENPEKELRYSTISKILPGFSKYHISNGLKKLENARLIETLNIQGKPKQYRILTS